MSILYLLLPEIDGNDYIDFILSTAVPASLAIGGGSPPLDT